MKIVVCNQIYHQLMIFALLRLNSSFAVWYPVIVEHAFLFFAISSSQIHTYSKDLITKICFHLLVFKYLWIAKLVVVGDLTYRTTHIISWRNEAPCPKLFHCHCCSLRLSVSSELFTYLLKRETRGLSTNHRISSAYNSMQPSTDLKTCHGPGGSLFVESVTELVL